MLSRQFIPQLKTVVDAHQFRTYKPLNLTASNNLTIEFIAPATQCAGFVDDLRELNQDELQAHPGVVLPFFLRGEPTFSHGDFDLDGAFLHNAEIVAYRRTGGWYFVATSLELVSAAMVTSPDTITDENRHKHFVTITAHDND